MKTTTLYIDIGNTAIKYAIKNSEGFIYILKHSVNKRDLILENIIPKLKFNNYNYIIMTSVRPSINYFIQEVAKELDIKIFDISKNISLKPYFNIFEKKILGYDLIALVIGSFKYGSNNIIISLGTATTITVVINNKFVGMNILPGIEIGYNTLIEKAELLKKYDYKLADNKLLYSKKVKEALNLGIVNSHKYIIYYWIGKIKEKHPKIDFKIVFTGGNLKLINIEDDYIKDDFLLMRGLDILNIPKKIKI